jgi:hypothetical protein
VWFVIVIVIVIVIEVIVIVIVIVIMHTEYFDMRYNPQPPRRKGKRA